MIVGQKRFCDKCGEEIEHDFYHSIEWTDVYVHRLERKHKCAEICARCYRDAFYTFFQECGEDVENEIEECSTEEMSDFEKFQDAVLIKGVKAPKNCHECDCLGYSDIIGLESVCPRSCNPYKYDSRPKDCPIEDIENEKEA